MKLLLFSGSHPRHLYINRKLIDFFDDILVFVMERESLLPDPPKNINNSDKELFIKHFENRNKVEKKIYGDLKPNNIFRECRVINITSEELNSERVANIVEEFNADFSFIFGVNLILDPVINKLPANKVNLHLGLSPWYKGGATLFYPFYNLHPQFCGCTFHQINKRADAGEIIHQCVPKLEYGDKIHDVGAKCVIKACNDLPLLIKFWLRERKLPGIKQSSSGKNWISRDFHPSQLRVIYQLFNDDIVDKYLDGELQQNKPKLISFIN